MGSLSSTLRASQDEKVKETLRYETKRSALLGTRVKLHQRLHYLKL